MTRLKMPQGHLSKRSRFLAIMGGGYTAIGVSYILAPTTESRQAGFAWLPDHIDANELGWTWMIVGLISFFASLRRRNCRTIESLTYGALAFPPTLWIFIFLVSYMLGHHPLGWVSAIYYALIVAIVLHASSWAEPVEREG